MARIEQFKKYKNSLVDSQVENMLTDPQFQYLSECSKSIDLILPIFSKIRNGTLALSEYGLSKGHARGLRSACFLDSSLVSTAFFAQNDLDDETFSLILEGLSR